MSPVQGDSLLGTKSESLLGTSPSKLSRQTGGSHSVLVHSINEDGTSQVGVPDFQSPLSWKPTLAWRLHVLAASPLWASQACGAAAVGPLGLRDACTLHPTQVA